MLGYQRHALHSRPMQEAVLEQKRDAKAQSLLKRTEIARSLIQCEESPSKHKFDQNHAENNVHERAGSALPLLEKIGD